MRWKTNEDAAAHMIGFLIAGVLFIAVIGAVLVSTDQAGRDSQPTDEAAGHVRSESLADLLVSSRGVGWESGADDLARLGLLGPNGSGLDTAHLDLMRGGTFEPTANGLLDYEEALVAIGADPGMDFHIRITPVGLNEVLLGSLDHIRTGYVGDWDVMVSVTVALASTEEMLAEAQVALDAQMGVHTVMEREALDELGLDYTDQIHIAVGAPLILVDYPFPLPDVPLLTVLNLPLIHGDVYPDQKAYLDLVFPGRIDQYDLLIVGSKVDHTALTSDDVKFAVRDWVLAGGTLIVLGSGSQNFQWMQPLFQAGTTTVNGGAYALDTQHPVLWQPTQLDWPQYDNHGLGWDINELGAGAHYDDFQHVIIEDGQDLLAISNAGALGDGRVFLTTYRPQEIAQTQSLNESMAFMENMILYADRSNLFLEYGPPVPDDASVYVAVRHSHIMDPTLGQVPVRIEVLTWAP